MIMSKTRPLFLKLSASIIDAGATARISQKPDSANTRRRWIVAEFAARLVSCFQPSRVINQSLDESMVFNRVISYYKLLNNHLAQMVFRDVPSGHAQT